MCELRTPCAGQGDLTVLVHVPDQRRAAACLSSAVQHVGPFLELPENPIAWALSLSWTLL